MTVAVFSICCDLANNSRYIILQTGRRESVKGKIQLLAIVSGGQVTALTDSGVLRDQKFKNVLAEAVRISESRSIAVAPV